MPPARRCTAAPSVLLGALTPYVSTGCRNALRWGESSHMLLRNRTPNIDPVSVAAAEGFEHVAASSIAVMRWLNTAGVDFVLVGPVARAIRGEIGAQGPVDIVPAPYGRNLDRLAYALNSVRAEQRSHGELIGAAPITSSAQALKLTAESLVRARRWQPTCGEHELDIEGRPAESPTYQQLLYEAVRFRVSPECASVEVAAQEDIEHYDHMRRTGPCTRDHRHPSLAVAAAASRPGPRPGSDPASRAAHRRRWRRARG